MDNVCPCIGMDWYGLAQIGMDWHGWALIGTHANPWFPPFFCPNRSFVQFRPPYIAPRPRWFGREGIYDALVLEHLGPSLENILQDPSCNGHKFPLSTVVGIADQLVCIPIYVCGDILINTYVDITIGVFTFIELCPLQPGARQHPNQRHR